MVGGIDVKNRLATRIENLESGSVVNYSFDVSCTDNLKGVGRVGGADANVTTSADKKSLAIAETEERKTE